MVSWPADAFVRQCEKFRPRYHAGDRLWVREAWSGVHSAREIKPKDRKDLCRPDEMEVWYWADGNPEHGDWEKPRPSLHMPRFASRITLEVTDVRIERLQSISEADAIAEGVSEDEQKGFWVPGVEHPNKDFPYLSRPTATEMYAALWDSINGSGAWDANPWVVAYTLGVVLQNIDSNREAQS